MNKRIPFLGEFGACALVIWLCISASGAGLQAGASKIDITPPIGYPMWGYGARHDLPCRGVMDPLHARALVFDADNERIALVSLDLGRAPSRKSTARIRDRIKVSGNIDHVFLVASHTHHGPVIELEDWPSREKSYVLELEEKICQVILEATKALQPARIGVASKEEPFNRNRHTKLYPKPVDRELLLLRVENEKGRVIASAVNFAAHPTMIEAKTLMFSADYPGSLANYVEKMTDAPCLFLQGAAGDLSANPNGSRDPKEFGKVLGAEVIALGQAIHCETIKNPTLEIREDEFVFKSRIDFSNPAVKATYAIAFFQALVDFYEREYRDGVRPHLTTAVLAGRIGFVGVSGEFFCSHSLNLKRRARLDHLFFLGYCNDYQQYFPTIEAASEGGYGADRTVATAEVGAGEKMMDRALIRLFQMRGKLPRELPESNRKISLPK